MHTTVYVTGSPSSCTVRGLCGHKGSSIHSCGFNYHIYITDCKMFISGPAMLKFKPTCIYNWLLETHLFISKAFQRARPKLNPCSSQTSLVLPQHSLSWWMAPASIQLPNLEPWGHSCQFPLGHHQQMICLHACLWSVSLHYNVSPLKAEISLIRHHASRARGMSGIKYLSTEIIKPYWLYLLSIS